MTPRGSVLQLVRDGATDSYWGRVELATETNPIPIIDSSARKASGTGRQIYNEKGICR